MIDISKWSTRTSSKTTDSVEDGRGTTLHARDNAPKMFATSAKTSTFVAGSAAIKSTTTRKSNATKRYVTRTTTRTTE